MHIAHYTLEITKQINSNGNKMNENIKFIHLEIILITVSLASMFSKCSYETECTVKNNLQNEKVILH